MAKLSSGSTQYRDQLLFYTYPKFDGDKQLLSPAVRNSKGKMSLALIDITTGVPVKYLTSFFLPADWFYHAGIKR